MKNKPKPCPFCGHNAIRIIDSVGDGYVAIECANFQCAAVGPRFRGLKGLEAAAQETAIELWNTRTGKA